MRCSHCGLHVYLGYIQWNFDIQTLFGETSYMSDYQGCQIIVVPIVWLSMDMSMNMVGIQGTYCTYTYGL